MDLSNVWMGIKKALTFGLVNEVKTEYALPKPRKKPDTTKFTQAHFDFINSARQEWERYNRANPSNRKSLQDLTEVINEHTGLNKSTRALARCWTGEINREDLPVGKPINHY